MTSQGNSPARFVAGAVDLGEIKARADARADAERQQHHRSGAAGTSSHHGGVHVVVDVTDTNFDSDVIKRSLQVPVIVVISSTRSPESQSVAKDLERLVHQADYTWVFANVRADSVPHIAQAFGARVIPTVIAMAQGRPVAVLEGPQQEDDLTAWIDQILSTVGRHLPGIPEEDTSSTARPDEEAITDPRLDAAEEALNSGNFAVALDMYDSIIADDPQNDDAKAARAHVPLLQRITDAQAAGEPVTEPGRTFLHADRYMVSSQEEEAFRVLLDLLKSSAGEQKTRVKDRLIELFALCDPADSRVISARREMASLLF